LKPTGKGSFTLKVRDRQVPANEGPWHVAWTEDGVEVNKVGLDADLETDIATFSQAFMGEPSLIELTWQGRFTVRSPGAVAQAASLLPALPVFCGDFF
jgi:hypothetical protein